MATERLLQELKIGDRPDIGLGNFQWRAVERPLKKAPGIIPDIVPIEKQPVGQIPISQVEDSLNKIFDSVTPPLPASAWPLTLLEDKTFAGKGYNTIWRPRATEEATPPEVPGSEPDVLQLNLTAETTTFSKSLGEVPNRGKQKDIFLSGVSYVQRVGAFEDPVTGLDNAKKPAGIHFEPGCLMFVPESKNPDGKVTKATINRMASIPHGTTINAQGLVPSKTPQKGAPVIPTTDIFPFNTGNPKSKITDTNIFPQLKYCPKPAGPRDQPNNSLPGDLNQFKAKGTISQDVFQNPNQILVNAIKGQEIESFIKFSLTTLPTSDFGGGGTANISFLGGTGALAASTVKGNENAHAVSMTVDYWIETVAKTIPIKAGKSEEQTIRVVSDTGIPGPLFVIPPTMKLAKDTTKRVTWTQLQYSQNVLLNFSTLSWPHISVATLGDVSRIPVDITGL